MSRLAAGLLLALLLGGCTAGRPTVAELAPLAGAEAGLGRCAALFPQGRWQLVHSLSFQLSDGASGSALGVVVVDGDRIDCALMTVEGFTLFAARSLRPGHLEVSRAVPPFSGPQFAAGLMSDVRRLFRPPEGAAAYGSLAGIGPVCRYTEAAAVTDLLPREDGCFRLERHGGPGSGPLHTVLARDCRPIGPAVFPHVLELSGSDPSDYSLTLRLISAEPLPCDSN